jgi:hypothetical protein
MAFVAWESGEGGISEILAGKLIENGAEAFTYALARADAEPDLVRLTWLASAISNAPVTVYRRMTAGTWVPLSTLQPGPTGTVICEDHDVLPGSHYEYRLGVVLAGAEHFFAEVRLETPLFRLSLLPLRPNPARGNLMFSITLPSRDPAVLQLFRVSGQLVDSKEVGSLGLGRHEILLAAGRRPASGIYIARLRQGQRSVSARVSLIR